MSSLDGTSILRGNRQMKNRCLRSLGFLTAGRLLVLAPVLAYMAVASTLNAAEGLGVVSLVVASVSQLISTLFIAPYVVRRFGSRAVIRVGLLLFVFYVFANVYPTWATLIPGAVCLAFGSTLQFFGCNLYVTEISENLSNAVGTSLNVIIIRAFALITIAMQSGHLWGNLINAVILDTDNEALSPNISFIECGSSYCGEKEQTLPMPPQRQLNILAAVLCSLAVAGWILIFFLGEFTTSKRETVSYWRLVRDTLKILTDKQMLLLTPLSLYVGQQICFMIGEYTKSFIGCTLGISQVGKVMMCFGAADMVSSMLQTPLARFLGRTPILLGGAAIQATCIVVMMLWTPDASNPVPLYIIAGAWGFADSIMFVQVFSYFSVLFPKRRESANLANLFWHAIGCSVAFGIIGLFCCRWDLIWTLFLLILSVIGYCILQYELKQQKKNRSKIHNGESEINNPLS